MTTNLIKDSNALVLCFWSTSASPLRMHWRPGYLVPSVWGSTSGLPTEEERRALLGVAVAIPGYLLSGSSGHTSEPCVPSTALAPLLLSLPLLFRAVALSLYSIWLCISLCSSSCFLHWLILALVARPFIATPPLSVRDFLHFRCHRHLWCRALTPGGASALPARPDTGARSCPDAVSPAWRSFAA